MSHNLTPPFAMSKAGLIVNGIPMLHIRLDEVTSKMHCIVTTESDNEVSLNIPLKLDRIFSYFSTRSLTDDEIESCHYIKTGRLCTDEEVWIHIATVLQTMRIAESI